MRPWRWVAVVVVIAVLVAAPIFYFYPPPPLGDSVASSTTADGPSGLQLRLALNVTDLAPGSRLRISVQEYNTFSSSNNISAARSWKVGGLSLGVCGAGAYPFGVAVFQGWYSADNISQGIPLRIFPQAACPLIIRLVTGYFFGPMSDSAVILPGSASAMPTAMSANVTLGGEYVSSESSGSSSLRPFSPGPYTVAAGDEWGGLAVLHFAVRGQTESPTGSIRNGTLDALISIGPTQPVCRANATIGPAPSTYSSIRAVVTSPDGINMTLPVGWLSNGCEASGTVRASLAPGAYLLNLSRCAFMGCGSTLPKSFSIVSNQTTDVTVYVDTGIR